MIFAKLSNIFIIKQLYLLYYIIIDKLSNIVTSRYYFREEINCRKNFEKNIYRNIFDIRVEFTIKNKSNKILDIYNNRLFLREK